MSPRRSKKQRGVEQTRFSFFSFSLLFCFAFKAYPQLPVRLMSAIIYASITRSRKPSLAVDFQPGAILIFSSADGKAVKRQEVNVSVIFEGHFAQCWLHDSTAIFFPPKETKFRCRRSVLNIMRQFEIDEATERRFSDGRGCTRRTCV